jgi:hypothetical protein
MRELDDDISDETRRMVARTRARAAASPTPGELADLLTAASVTRAPEMTAEQIRVLSRDTLAQAQQVSYLLGKLAGLLEDGL